MSTVVDYDGQLECLPVSSPQDIVREAEEESEEEERLEGGGEIRRHQGRKLVKKEDGDDGSSEVQRGTWWRRWGIAFGKHRRRIGCEG